MHRATTLGLATLLATGAQAADVELVHSGWVLEADGAAAAPSARLRVALYPDATSAGPAAWEDQFDGALDAYGRFTVVLGSGAPLPHTVLDLPELWIEHQIVGKEPLRPRQLLYRVPRAEVAHRVAAGAPAPSCGEAGAMLWSTEDAALLVCDGAAWQVVESRVRRTLVRHDAALRWSDGSAAPSCLAYLQHADYRAEGDDRYWIDPSGAGAFEVECAMAAGGWTVLWRLPSATPSDAVWGWNGTSASTSFNGADGYNARAAWDVAFSEWRVGSPTQGWHSTNYAGRFTDTVVIQTNVKAIPGYTERPYDDAYHVGFHQVRPNSQCACRLSAGFDNDVGFNDTQHGVLCRGHNVAGNPPRAAINHVVSAGFSLMAR